MGVYLYTDEWLPGENTLLYMPLNGDAKDEVSGTYGTRSGTTQYETLASGIQVANCNASSYILTPSIAMNTALTLSCWLYMVSWAFVRCDGSATPRNFYQLSIESGGAGGGWYYNGTYYGGTTSGNTGWKHCTLTCGSNGVDVYVNGTSIYHNNQSSFVWKTQQRGINYEQQGDHVKGNGYYSNLIIENKARTATEILNYYNQTKSNYGL